MYQIKKKALFLDRDGTINVDKGYVYKPKDFIFIDGIIDAIKKYNRMNYLVIVITNQSGIGRGLYTESDMISLHNYVDRLLARNNAHIDKWYYCPHHPIYGIGEYKVECNCRKPKTGMIESAINDFGINVNQSLLVGDKETDIICGERMNIESMYTGDFITLCEKL